MDNTARLASYEKQNAGRPLTGKQIRRLARHDDSPSSARAFAPWSQRFYRQREIRQHFRPTIDNVRVPTGRVGRSRFGPALGMAGLQQAFFPVRSAKAKTADIGQAALESQRGRFGVRTAHGRRKGAGRRASRGR